MGTWLWMQLWLAIKPNLKCTQFGKYKKEYEDKIAEAEANIDRASSECQAVVDVHTKLAAEKNELVLALQSGGSAVQEIIDKTTRLENARDDLRKQVDQTNARIKGEDDTINGIEQAGGKVTADACRLREEIKELEATIEKCEDDKMTKDSQIRTLREEIAHQEDLISKLRRQASAVTLPPACSIPLMVSSSPLMRALVWSTCFLRSSLAFSRRVVLSMIS